MKRKTANELLAESFRELTEPKSIDRITVQDIVDNCGYSPAFPCATKNRAYPNMFSFR